MRCPYCRHPDSRVVDSREADDGQLIRRRRACPECGRRFTTVEEAVLAVVKRSGVTEPFSRPKIIAGVRRACQGRPVDDDALALLAQRVEESVRARGAAEVPSHEVGLAILGPLRDLDEVAFLRFASVYRSFDSVEDFEREIAALRADGRTRENPRSGGDGTPTPGRGGPVPSGRGAGPPRPDGAGTVGKGGAGAAAGSGAAGVAAPQGGGVTPTPAGAAIS
jgi:transcriptional repressor NrdR